jgi:predicted amidohydrolase YtcJ
MKPTLLTILLVLLSSIAANAQTVIVTNVTGYSLSSAGSAANRLRTFDRLVIVDGKVSNVSSGATTPPPAGATIVDGGGKTLLPGLIDAHGHVADLGQARLQADLRGTTSLEVALDRVRTFAAANPRDAWVRGDGWNQVLWPGKQFPTAKDLDRIVSDRPALLTRIDGHAIWVNSAALRLAGVTSATKDPAGGQIVRDAQGNPTGVLLDAAKPLIEQKLPEQTDVDIKRALTTALNELAALGMTGVHDAGVSVREFHLYQELGAAGSLPIRVNAMLADSPDARTALDAGPRPLEFEDHLQMISVKAWVDGALGSRGAALLADYRDQPHHRGLMLYTGEQMETLARLTAAKGWQLNVHAIGDAGNRRVLDAFEKMLTPAQRHALRPRIEHAQVIALEDIPRFAKLDVIASMQPTHATSDMNMAEDRLGPDRIKGAYAWRTLFKAGARLAGGSDFPVERPNPFLGLYAAVTRQDAAGRPPGGWYPAEKLTREEALQLFTLDAAFAGHMETQVGSLEPGKWADFILIDRDYFKVPENEIDDIKVVATYVGGRRIANH